MGDSAGLQLQTLEELARRIVRRRVASDGERRLAMRTAVRSVDDPLMSTRGIAAMLERSYRDMRDSGVRLSSVRLRRAPVARAFAEYEKLIAALGAIDPADLLEMAARDVSGVKPQIVAGFYDMTGVQWALIDALARAGKIVAFFSPTAPHPAFGHLLPASGEKGNDERAAPPWDIREYERRDVEVREVCFAIERLIAEGTSPREIGAVTRALDDYDLHLFHRYATFPLSRVESTPLLAHRLGRAIASLLRIRERGFPRGEVLELLRDGIRFETRINADAADRETRAKRIAGGTSAELRASRKTTTREIDDYIALVAEVEKIAPEGARRGSEWSAWLTNVASRFRIEAEVDLAALERVETIADLFRRADAMRTTFDAAALLDAIENESIDAGTIAGATRDAVWIGDVMKFRGRTFRHLFAVRMQDDSFPQRRTEDPLLPDSERRTLGIREIGDGRDEERILFQLLFDGTDHITFTFSSSDGFGKVLRPSQLLKNFVVEQRPSEKAALLKHFTFRVSELPRNLATSQPRNRQLQLLARAATNGPFDGFLTDPALLERFTNTRPSPTALEDFGECPQKFLMKHLLGAFDVDNPERELQIHHREKGSIDHRILETFYRSLTDADYVTASESLPEVPRELIARLERAIDAEFDRFESDAPAFNQNIRAIERRATKRILRDFIARDLTDIFETNFRPRQFEYKFERGRIDRIDMDGDRIRIIDYKSGKALRHVNLAEKIDRGVRLQLAVYANAIAEAFQTDPANVIGAIRPLASGEAKPASFTFNLGEKRAALLETLAIFSRAIAGGRFPAFPNEKDFNSCKYCPVNHSCRTKHDAEEKYAVSQLHDPRTLLQQLEGAS
ncbi:MAG TPA: PD-(D/E)XK nuclease family protein [Thermoanaerobaculia bacterium]|nr:PD-(D/E)XK nuclease family protein [Thermoanaerobaculia bacterium]